MSNHDELQSSAESFEMLYRLASKIDGASFTATRDVTVDGADEKGWRKVKPAGEAKYRFDLPGCFAVESPNVNVVYLAVAFVTAKVLEPKRD